MLMRSPRLRALLEQLLHTHDTPQRTALAFAVGLFFGFSPPLGLHTVLGLSAAFAFGLNRVAVLIGIYANLPWILPAYYSLATLLGAALLGIDMPPGLLKQLTESLADRSWGEIWNLARPLLRAYTVGSTLGAVAVAVTGYRVALAAIIAHRRRAAAETREPAE